MFQKIYNTKLDIYGCTYMVCTVDLIHVNVVMIMANKFKKCFN